SGSLAQGDINSGQTQYGVSGSITFVTRGPWTLNIVINGPQGQGKAALPITVVALPPMPTWLAWNIGLLPAYGLLVFWIVQVWRKSTDQPERTELPENLHADGRSVLHGSSS
ncbi:MAG TPA: hypothetical protein VKR42_06710, partial [Ktedonobacteraceae bacterium]|nr:hypothetical protein [Ktedonobacteraceae bacterium]